MKRTPLKRRTPLQAKEGLKRKPFKPSARSIRRMKAERQRRRDVYAYLYEHCPVNEQGRRICVKCGRPLDHHWMGYQMHHVKPLSQGGKTSVDNCQLWCYPCHYRRHNGTTPK